MMPNVAGGSPTGSWLEAILSECTAESLRAAVFRSISPRAAMGSNGSSAASARWPSSVTLRQLRAPREAIRGRRVEAAGAEQSRLHHQATEALRWSECRVDEDGRPVGPCRLVRPGGGQPHGLACDGGRQHFVQLESPILE